MNPKIYDASMATGVVLASVGVGLVSVPGGLVTAGLLIIALTFAGALLMRKRG